MLRGAQENWGWGMMDIIPCPYCKNLCRRDFGITAVVYWCSSCARYINQWEIKIK